jgi:hypothetical protein
VYIEGGGWCYNEKDCLQRSRISSADATAGQGSSTRWGSISGCGCMNARPDGTIDDTWYVLSVRNRLCVCEDPASSPTEIVMPAALPHQ